MNTEQHDTEETTARAVVDLLDQGSRSLDEPTLSRLYSARRAAMSGLHASSSGIGVLALRQHPGLVSVGALSALLVAAWFVASPPAEQQAPLDSGKLDIELLTGEVPPQVFADWSLATQENIEDVCLSDS